MVDSDIKNSLWIFIENQLTIDFPTYISNSYSSKEAFYQTVADFDLDESLDQWFRECQEKTETPILSEKIAAKLTRLLRPKLEYYFGGIFKNLFKTVILREINKLDLSHDKIDQKSLEDFINIFNEQVQKFLIPQIINKFQEGIRDMVEDDSAIITTISESLRETEERTIKSEDKTRELDRATGELKGKTADLERTTASLKTKTGELERNSAILTTKIGELERKTNGLSTKTGELEEESKIKIKFFGLLNSEIPVKNNLIVLNALFALIVLFLIAAFLFITLAIIKIKQSSNTIDLTEIEKTLDKILENQKIIKKTEKIVYESFRGTKKDKDGTTILGLEIDILSEIYRWECGNFKKIVRGNKKYDPKLIINDYKENENLKSSKGLICVGMASIEGERGDEEGRAEKRVETLLDAARKANVDADCIIYGLNLGQFIGKTGEDEQAACSDSTRWQRRVVLLKIIKKRPNLQDEELKDGVISILEEKVKNEHIKFPFDIREYSKFRNLTLMYGSSKEAVQHHGRDVNEETPVNSTNEQ